MISLHIIHTRPKFFVSADELPKVNRAIAIHIKRPEHVLSEFRRIAIWEEISVNLFEFIHGQVTRWTVLQKALIPEYDVNNWASGKGRSCFSLT